MSFEQFGKQQHISELLRRSLEQGRLAHGYLFVGDSLPEMEGVAATLAKTLNCRQSPRRAANGIALDSCDQCPSCRQIDNATHPDIHWVRPESKSRIITIDQMRDLMQTIQLKPLEADYKVAVIVAADRLNTQAANSFLKTLEEPPPKSAIILLTTDPQRILETIFSRCLRLNFAGDTTPVFDAGLMEFLKTFSDCVAADPKSILARYQLLSILTARLSANRESIEKDLTARSPLERYTDLEASLREKWEEELSAAIEAEYRRRRSDLVACLLCWMRDVWTLTLTPSATGLFLPQVANATRAVSLRLSPDKALKNLGVLQKTQRLLETNVQEALLLENGLLQLSL